MNGDYPFLYDAAGEFERCGECGSRKRTDRDCALCASPEGPAERAGLAAHRQRIHDQWAAAMDEVGAHQAELEQHEREAS